MYLTAAQGRDGLRGRGDPLMAAPSTGRRRPAGRRAAASSGARGARATASTAASDSSASSSSSSSCSSAAGPWRSPRRRSTSRRSPRSSRPPRSCCPRTAARSSTGTATSSPSASRSRPCTRTRTCCRTPRRGRRALRRAADQPPPRASRRGGGAVEGKRESGFAYVARKVDPELAKAALALDLPGVGSYTEEERTYPLKGTAAQVLGFAGTENTGLAGMELLYDEELSGEAGSETIVRDPAGHALKTVAHHEPASGQNVRLTLDSEIQYYAEDVLEKTLRDTRRQVGRLDRDGPAHGRGARHGQRHERGVPRLRQGRHGRREEPRRHRRVRARLDLQARHDLRRACRRDRQAGLPSSRSRRASTWPTARSTSRTRAGPSRTRCARSCSGPATSAR